MLRQSVKATHPLAILGVKMKTLCTCAALVGSVLLLSSEDAFSHSGNGLEPSGWQGATDQREDGYGYGPGPGPGPGPGWQGFAPIWQDGPSHRRHGFWPWITPSAIAPPAIAYQNFLQDDHAQPQPLMGAWPSGPIYRDSSGEYCREYKSWNIVNGVRQQDHGTACQQQDDAWRIVR